MIPSRLRFVICAGQRRSASTWLFEYVKKMLDAHPMRVYAWDGATYHPPSDSLITVVKAHLPHPLMDDHRTLVLYSHRPCSDRLESVRRRFYPNGLGYRRTVEEIATDDSIHLFRTPRADYVLPYPRFIDEPQSVCSELAGLLNICGANSQRDPWATYHEVTEHIEKTWPNHRTRHDGES